jgi:hypothetical protein
MFLPRLASFLALVSMMGSTVQTSNMVSICDILAAPQKYSGQTVTVRALLGSSLNGTDFDELGPLESERCYSPRRRDALRIGIAASAILPEPPKGWGPDWDSYDRAVNIIAALLEKNPRSRILVTIEGIIYDGGPSPSGKVPHPWHPADMRIAVWKDVQGL